MVEWSAWECCQATLQAERRDFSRWFGRRRAERSGSRRRRGVPLDARHGDGRFGSLPGGSRNSIATGVSADGSVVVGASHGQSGLEAFVWDSTHGMRSVRDVLVNNLGLRARPHGLETNVGILRIRRRLDDRRMWNQPQRQHGGLDRAYLTLVIGMTTAAAP